MRRPCFVWPGVLHRTVVVALVFRLHSCSTTVPAQALDGDGAQHVVWRAARRRYLRSVRLISDPAAGPAQLIFRTGAWWCEGSQQQHRLQWSRRAFATAAAHLPTHVPFAVWYCSSLWVQWRVGRGSMHVQLHTTHGTGCHVFRRELFDPATAIARPAGRSRYARE